MNVIVTIVGQIVVDDQGDLLDVDTSGEKISILAPVGSALLGLSQGDEIEWPRPGGGVLHVRIKEVTYQPERAGEHHR